MIWISGSMPVLRVKSASTAWSSLGAQCLLLAELRTKHASNLATDWFCFPLITGTRGIQGDHFRDRPIAAIGLPPSTGLLKSAFHAQAMHEF